MSDSHALQFSTSTPPRLRAWTEPGIIHGFLGRLGGRSRGAYESLNLSHFVGDDPQAVADNWERLRGTLPESIVFSRVNQVHGNAVRVVTHTDAATRPRADGMATREPGIILGIFTADCVPILMVSSPPQVACALHAGWRGVLAGIAANGVRRMEEMGIPASAVRVALGPSVGPCCFEVDAELAGRFVREIPSSARQARGGNPGKAFLNLRGIIRDQLIEAGVPAQAITNSGPCTRCASDQYFSRRAAAGVTTGLQMSFVGFMP
ncbi:MAG TPA: peptidoglycan editing factor PgeF [Candidatus Binataceae bacterium]|nr:peptidoglycan editing factor PgeF [Candidatus Binataceae bacterium]